jgi:hypothetical protein
VVDDSDDFASYIEQGISGSESDSNGDAPYIIGGTALPSAGGDAVTVSGVVYSALPSGSGILVVADGKSTTIELSSTSGGAPGRTTAATSTGGSTSSGAEESKAASTDATFSADAGSSSDAASSAAGHLTRLSGCVCITAMALLFML